MKRIFLALALLAAILAGVTSTSGQGTSPVAELATVMNIVDGDTIDVRFESGLEARIRYIGINAPEADDPCGPEAAEANEWWVANQRVAMRRDVSETDQYGRLLRYVYVRGTFVNAELVAAGWAEAVEYPPDTAFAEWFEYLELEARNAELACHSLNAFEGDVPTSSVEIVTVTAASDTVNLRSGPGTNYALAGTLSAGQTATAEGRSGDWLLLTGGGWVATWVVTVTGDLAQLPDVAAPSAPETQRQPTNPAVAQPTALPPAGPAFTCDCSKACPAIASCEEAHFQLRDCGCTRLDGDGDGVPCEEICPGG